MRNATRDKTTRRKQALHQIAQVPFYGQAIDALKDQDDKIWVSIRRVCDLLSINFSNQLKKLRREKWAVVVIMTTTGPDKKSYETAMLDLASLPLWMATVHDGKVRRNSVPSS